MSRWVSSSKRIIEVVGHVELSGESAELSPLPVLFDWDEPHDWLPSLGNDDVLTCYRGVQQTRQLTLGRMDIVGRHQSLLGELAKLSP
jgi:hypothetical protein